MTTFILLCVTLIITFVVITLLSALLLLDKDFSKTKHNLVDFWEKIEPDHIQNFSYYPNYNFTLERDHITNTFTDSMLNFSIVYQDNDNDDNDDIQTTKVVDIATKFKKPYKKPVLMTQYQENFESELDTELESLELESELERLELESELDTELESLELESELERLELESELDTEIKDTELNIKHLICIDKKGITNPIAKQKSEATRNNRNTTNFNKLDKIVQECKKPSNIIFSFDTNIELDFFDVIEEKPIKLGINFKYASKDNSYNISIYEKYKLIESTKNDSIISTTQSFEGTSIPITKQEFMDLVYNNDVQALSGNVTNKIISLPYKQFQLSLKQGSKFISKDVTKEKLTKLCVHNGSVISTDSFQMYKHTLFTSELEHKFLLDINQIKELTSFKLSEVSEVTISINYDIVQFKLGTNTFTYPLLSDFIPYESIFYDYSKALTKLTINNKVMQDTLKALQPSISKDSPVILFEVANNKVMLACNDDSSRANFPLECIKIEGLNMKVGLSNRYLLEILKTLKAFGGKELNMFLNGDQVIVVLKYDDVECLIMPMDLD